MYKQRGHLDTAATLFCTILRCLNKHNTRYNLYHISKSGNKNKEFERLTVIQFESQTILLTKIAKKYLDMKTGFQVLTFKNLIFCNLINNFCVLIE